MTYRVGIIGMGFAPLPLRGRISFTQPECQVDCRDEIVRSGQPALGSLCYNETTVRVGRHVGIKTVSPPLRLTDGDGLNLCFVASHY